MRATAGIHSGKSSTLADCAALTRSPSGQSRRSSPDDHVPRRRDQGPRPDDVAPGGGMSASVCAIANGGPSGGGAEGVGGISDEEGLIDGGTAPGQKKT